MSTKLPKFAGVTSWEQYRQVLDAIARSNGWDDATAALQLLSHLEGNMLNVALLVPEVKQVMRTGTGRGAYGTLQITGTVCGLSTSVREDGGGPVNFRHSVRDISCQSLRGHGSHCTTSPST